MRCLVVDDDPSVCETVESFLDRIDGVESCCKAGDGVTALSLVSSGGIDAAFFDLELPGLDGVSLIKSLPETLPAVVISAKRDGGVRSDEVNVVDHLIKPFEFPRFYHAVQKLKERIASASSAGNTVPASVGSRGRGRTVFVRDGTRIVRIDIDHLQLLKAESNYVEFISMDSSVLSLISMKRLEGILPEEFIRIHRSYIVNSNHLAKIEDGWVYVGKHKLPISQRYRDEVVKRLRVIN